MCVAGGWESSEWEWNDVEGHIAFWHLRVSEQEVLDQ